jgi:hypothetical protein
MWLFARAYLAPHLAQEADKAWFLAGNPGLNRITVVYS